MDGEQRHIELVPEDLVYTARVEETLFEPGDIDEFLRALRRSKQELEMARIQFDTVVDPMLIDHMVFRIGAAERHLNYLLRLARKHNLSVDGIDWAWFEGD